jgi:phage baseplate assembly protein W
VTEVVIGLLSGAAGALLTTVLRISHERAAELRTRMLEAADNFVAAAASGTDVMHRTSLKVFPIRTFGADMSDAVARPLEKDAEVALSEAREVFGAVIRHLPRIRLLFGVDSPATHEADIAAAAIGEALIVVLEGTPSDEDDADAMWDTLEELRQRSDDAVAGFSRLAREAIVGRRWSLRP